MPGALAERGEDGWRHAPTRLEVRRGHLVELDRVIEIPLAHRKVRRDARQLNVALHPFELRGEPAGAVKLLHRDLDRPQRGGVGEALEKLPPQIDEALHRSLAVRRVVADDEPAAVVLDRPGDDLAGAGAELVGQNDKGAVPGNTGIDVVILLDPLLGILDLHDRPLVDEQARQRDRLGERAAAVVAQIEADAVDPLRAEVVDQLLCVAGAALVVGLPLPGPGHVHIEARQIDVTDPPRRAVGLAAGLDELAAGLAVLELDLRACDVVFLRRRLADRDDFQADDRPPLAADELHDLVEIHVDDIDDVAFGSLPHADDAVFLRQPAVTVGGSPRDDLRHGGVAILALERGPDAVELEPHPDLEVLEGAGGHEARVRVERAGQTREIRLEELVGGHLVHPLGEAAIAPRELILGLFGGGLVHLLDQEVVFDSLPPVVDRLRLVLGPLRLVAVDDDRFILGEIERLGEKLLNQRHARVDPLEKPLEDLVGKGDIPPLDEIVEHLPLRDEAVDVALEEIDLHRVEGLEKDPEPAARDLVVDRMVGEVLALDVALHRQRDLTVVRPGLGSRCGRWRRILGRGPPEGEQRHHDKQPEAKPHRGSCFPEASRCRRSVQPTLGRIDDRRVHA